MEVIIISVEEYELLKAKYDFEEHAGIYKIVKSRQKENIENAISLEEILNNYWLDKNQL